MERLAIVIIGYNRSDALRNLLSSMEKIRTERSDISLIFSLEGGVSEDVAIMAKEYKWTHGEKKIVSHIRRLGLRQHFIWVGDQTEEYDNVLFLEDDLYVSPCIIDSSEQLISYYKNDDDVAGISLYSPLLCEFNARRFYQIEDGSDVYFFQHPYWGNIWQKNKWRAFKQWLKTYERHDEMLPVYVRNWNETSFKVIFIQYLLETNRTLAFSRISLVDNAGYAGVHNRSSSNTFAVPLLLKERTLKLVDLDKSRARYDAYFEIESTVLKLFNPSLAEYDFQVDLQDTRDVILKPFILTKKRSRKPILSFSGGMKPPEMNVALNRPGGDIVLTARDDVEDKRGQEFRWFDDLLSNNMFGKRNLFKMFKQTFWYLMKSF